LNYLHHFENKAIKVDLSYSGKLRQHNCLA